MLSNYYMQRGLNKGTQKLIESSVFNNPQVVANSWFFVAPSKQLKHNNLMGLQIAKQYIVFYRGEDGRVRALDGFCPHMGTDLALGKVKGKQIQCFFHHWEFNGHGECKKIPCGHERTKDIRIQNYDVIEKYGSIWVYPASVADIELGHFCEHDSDMDLDVDHDKSFERNCHHHINMINGLDAQHLKTVHNLNIDMKSEVKEEKRVIKIDLKGDIPRGTLVERFSHFILGGQYGYSMKYYDASIGFLTLMKHVRILGVWEIPRLQMIFAYRPIDGGRSFVQPMYVQEKRKGIKGWLINRFLFWLTKRAFYSLRDEDGKVYDNMRFSPNHLLPMDQLLSKYIHYVNKLKPSIWSEVSPDGDSSGKTKQSEFELFQ